MAFNKNYITASEIGEYVYCPRGWWLKIKGTNETTPAMIRGIAHHESLFRRIEWSFKLKLIALLLLGIGFLIVLLIGRIILGL